MGILDWWRDRGSGGTDGDDTIRDTYRSNTINVLAGNDTVYLSFGDDQVDGGDGIDTVVLRGELSEWEITIPHGTVHASSPPTQAWPFRPDQKAAD